MSSPHRMTYLFFFRDLYHRDRAALFREWGCPDAVIADAERSQGWQRKLLDHCIKTVGIEPVHAAIIKRTDVVRSRLRKA